MTFVYGIAIIAIAIMYLALIVASLIATSYAAEFALSYIIAFLQHRRMVRDLRRAIRSGLKYDHMHAVARAIVDPLPDAVVKHVDEVERAKAALQEYTIRREPGSSLGSWRRVPWNADQIRAHNDALASEDTQAPSTETI